MRLWRLSSERHLLTAFSGEGARLSSGRWNSTGTAVVYTSEHLSLAAMEYLVHVDEKYTPAGLVSIETEFPFAGDLAQAKRDLLQALPTGWRDNYRQTQHFGDAWIASAESAILPVPSVVITGEWNILFNPLHPDASTLVRIAANPFALDPRLFKRS